MKASVIQASEPLRALTNNPKLQEKLPGFKISMGYGLHAGWAIEEGTGSMLKIDASYLSPNVNLATASYTMHAWYMTGGS